MENLVVSALFWKNVMDQDLPAKTIVKKQTQAHQTLIIPAHKPIKTTYIKSKKSSQKTHIIIAPHPDDEILCCSTKIKELKDLGQNVKIIYLTNGDAHTLNSPKKSKNYGEKRKKESLKALSKVGLKSTDAYFLGFPDSHLDQLNTKKSIRSKYTRQNRSSKNSTFPFTPYTQKHLARNLSKLLNKFDIQTIYIPSQKDNHPDHQFAGNIIKELIVPQQQINILEYTIHGNNKIGKSLNPQKLKLIQIFKSQFHDLNHKYFLEKFASISEIFTPIKKQLIGKTN